MRLKAISSKSEAIRTAAAKATQASYLLRDFSALVGLIKPQRLSRFSTDDALWEANAPTLLSKTDIQLVKI